MKKLFALLLALMMALSLAACGGGDSSGDKTPSGDSGQQGGSSGQLTQEELDDVEEALEILEALKPEGWDENNFGAYIYDVWDEDFLPDCLPGPVDGVKVDQTTLKDYSHDVLNGDYSVGPLYYESYEDYREYGVRFYATEAQLDAWLDALRAKGFSGGQVSDRDSEWWEFYFCDNDGWFVYVFFNTNDNEDGQFDGAASVHATNDLFPLPEAIAGESIPLPQRGMTSNDYTEYYTAYDMNYDDVDFDLTSSTFSELGEYFAAWFSYYGTEIQDAKDYAQTLVGAGWELQYESESDGCYYSTQHKDGIYGVVNYYDYDVMLEVGFSDIIENLQY